MPKQVLKIDRFEKGILSAYDSKDIPVGALVSAKACDVGTIGIVKLTPKAEAEGESLDAGIGSEYLGSTYTLPPGHGFFIFPSDYTRPISNGIALNEETEFYVYSHGVNVYLLEKANLVWDGGIAGASTFDLDKPTITLGSDGSSDALIKPVFYYGAGALRVADGNYTNSGNDVGLKNKWFGHIKRSLFPMATASNTDSEITNHNRWHVDNQELIPPTLGSGANGGASYGDSWTDFQGANIAGSVHFNNDNTSVVAPANDDFLKIWVDSAANANGTWDINESNYKFYLSFIYDGSQESPVTYLGNLATHASDQESIFAGVTIQYHENADGTSNETPDAHWRVNPRITGARLYYTDPNDGEGTKYLLLDIDFIKGCKKADEISYSDWKVDTTDYVVFECPENIIGSAIASTTKGFEFIDPPKALTYDILNGYGADEVTAAKYKCATILNNRCYIGNIQQEDNVGDGFASAPIYPDRIVRSPINFEGNPQFDTFPASQKMDVGVNDGDDIIALEGYADRLLVFKKKTIYIVNVAQDGQEGIENQISYNGINSPSQVVKFEGGVAWANPNGCYLYNGEQVKNLTEGKIYSGGKWEPSSNVSWSGGSLSQSWQLDPTHTPAITYLFSKKQLWVSISMNGDDQSNDAWVYDFKTEGRTMASASMGTNTRNRSNIVLDGSGIPRFLEFDPSGSAERFQVYTLKNLSVKNTEFKLVTPDIDFGAPGVKKKIYKVYVSFKTDEAATNVKVNYSTNGSVEFAKTFQDGDNFASNDLNTSANQDFSTNINEGEGVFDFSSDNSSATSNLATRVVSNNSIQYPNNTTQQGYARYNLGTLEARNYNFSFYFKPGFTSISRKENVKASQGVISIGTSDANPSTNRVVHQIVGQEGAYKLNYKATAAAHYLYIQNQSAVSGDFIEVSNPSNVEESDYYVAELKPTTSSEANNVYSFQLKFEADGQVPKGFEIGDISIIYRMKNVK